MLIDLMICKAILVTAFIWVQFVGPSHSNPSPLATFQHANISHGRKGLNPGDLGSNFSPRMDFEQWKPLTGRGDPLRNDPTYDYEPPVLERVHYWADDTRVERERIPEKKSEVLVLGSIEIQETDLGIKYDVSDGSKVPLELYKKGFVDNDENNYKPQNASKKKKRNKREIYLDDLWATEDGKF
ncbi:unnamed protein product, partial [Iphiclides podalirius]